MLRRISGLLRGAVRGEGRDEISSQMDSGASDAEILDYFANRYGDQVLLEPPRTGLGAVVWLLPVLVVAAALIMLGFAFPRWRAAPNAGPGPIVEPGSIVESDGVNAAAPEGESSASIGTATASSRPRWRRPALAVGLVGFVGLAAWLVIGGTEDRDSNLAAAEGGPATELSNCQGLAMSEPDKAIDCYDGVLAESPDDTEALTYRGWASVRAGEVDAGRQDLRRAVELDPEYADPRVFLAVVAANEGDFETAAEELQAFWANDPSEIATSVVSSEGLERKVFFGLMSGPTRDCWQSAAESSDGGAIDQAFLDALGSCLDGVLAADPADRFARLSRAMAYVGPDTADPGAAQMLLENILAEDPDDSDALALLASLELASGDLDSAGENLDRLEGLPRGSAAFLIGDAATLREAFSAARARRVAESRRRLTRIEDHRRRGRLTTAGGHRHVRSDRSRKSTDGGRCCDPHLWGVERS